MPANNELIWLLTEGKKQIQINKTGPLQGGSESKFDFWFFFECICKTWKIFDDKPF